MIFTPLRLLAPLLLWATWTPNATAQAPVEVWAQMPGLQAAALSPDGTTFAYLQPYRDEVHLFVQDVDGEKPFAVLPPVQDTRYLRLDWASDDYLLVLIGVPAKASERTRSGRTRQELATTAQDSRSLAFASDTRLLTFSRDGKPVAGVVKSATKIKINSRLVPEDLTPPVSQHEVIHTLPGTQEEILMVLDEDHDDYFEIRRVNILDGEYENIVGNTSGIAHWALDAEARTAIGYGFLREDFVAALKEPGREVALTSELDWLESGWLPVGIGAGSGDLYVRGYEATGRAAIRRAGFAAGELGAPVATRPARDAGGLIRSRGGQIVGTWYADQPGADQYTDAERQRWQRVVDNSLAEAVNRIVSESLDGSRKLVLSRAGTEPAGLLLLDTEAGQLDYLPVFSEEKPLPFAVTGSDVEIAAGVPGRLTAARSGTGAGIVLAYPGARTPQDFSSRFLAGFLADRGYTVLTVYYRNSAQLGADVAAAAAWLGDQEGVDAARIGVVGWSAGGTAAALAASQAPERLRCLVTINGIFDLERLYENREGNAASAAWLQALAPSRAGLDKLSPLEVARDIRLPALVVHSQDDSRLARRGSEQFLGKLKTPKRQSQYLKIERGGQWLDNPEARRKLLQGLEAFLAKHLRPAGG